MITPAATAPPTNTPVAGNSSSAASSSSSALGLNENDFLQLLTTQLQYQNPLDPVSSSDFATQLAQFSQLDGIQQLNTSFNNMLLLQSITQGANLIGKQVSYGVGNTPSTGTVSSVQISGGQLVLMVGGNSVPLSQVQSIGS